MALLEGVGEHFDVVHYNQVAADVEVLQAAISLADHFAQLRRRLARELCVGEMAHTEAARVEEALGDSQASVVSDLCVVVEADLAKASAHGEQLLDGLGRVLADEVMGEEEAFHARERIEGLEDVIGTSAANPVVLKPECLQMCLVAEHRREFPHRVVI